MGPRLHTHPPALGMHSWSYTVVHGHLWVVRPEPVLVSPQEVIIENALLSRSGPAAKKFFVPIPVPSAAYLFLFHYLLLAQGEIHSLI